MKRAVDVKPMKNYLLLVKFDNGEVRVFNCFSLLQNKLYAEIADVDFFKTVHIDEMGVVCWSDAIDINPFDLYEKSEDISNFTFLQTAKLLDALPEEDISTVNTIMKKHVIAWDPDFTKLTAEEREILEKSDAEMHKGDYISEEDFWS